MFQAVLDKLPHEDFGVDSTPNQKQDVADVLNKLVNDLKVDLCRTSLTADDIKRLCRTLEAFVVVPKDGSTVVTYDDHSVDTIILTECLRCLRNACVQNENNQNVIGQSDAIQCIRHLVTGVCSSQTGLMSESDRTLIRCAVQLAGNLVSGNQKTRWLVWSVLFPQSILSVFRCNDVRASTYSCMLLNECIADDLVRQQLMKQPEGHAIIDQVLRICEQEMQHDFSLQIMQKLLTTSDFMLSTYDSLPTTAKITLLDILAALLSQTDGPKHAATGETSYNAKDGGGGGIKRDTGVPVFSMAYLAEQFEEKAKGMITFVTEEQDRESTEQKTPLLILRLLSVLGIAAANHEVYKPLQDRESLLQTAIDLLQRTHLASTKKKPTPKTPASTQQPRLNTASLEPEDMGPVYGLKRDLVRLIGNMCYKHRANQDKVRELHGIPLILEHCNIDDQNPYISQWAIFTIRNLCENNHENQAYIAAMTTKGAAPPTDFLREAGVEVEMRGDTPCIKSTTNRK